MGHPCISFASNFSHMDRWLQILILVICEIVVGLKLELRLEVLVLWMGHPCIIFAFHYCHINGPSMVTQGSFKI